MYVNENGSMNGNGKHNGKSLLGEVALEYGSAQLGAISPLLAAATRVIRARQTAQATAPKPAPSHPASPGKISPFDFLRRQAAQRRMSTVLPKPSVNIVTLPNGTAVPAAILPANPLTDVHVGGTRTDPYTYRGDVDPGPPGAQYAGTQGGSGGSSFGPPADLPPVEVGTLPEGDGDSTGGPALAGLSGLTGNPLVLGLIALAAFTMLDGKPKRKRRR
jgi:hypothetical protein